MADPANEEEWAFQRRKRAKAALVPPGGEESRRRDRRVCPFRQIDHNIDNFGP